MATLLIAESHWQAWRLVTSATGRQLSGLQKGAQALRWRLPSRALWRPRALDVAAAALVRHISLCSVADFKLELVAGLDVRQREHEEEQGSGGPPQVIAPMDMISGGNAKDTMLEESRNKSQQRHYIGDVSLGTQRELSVPLEVSAPPSLDMTAVWPADAAGEPACKWEVGVGALTAHGAIREAAGASMGVLSTLVVSLSLRAAFLPCVGGTFAGCCADPLGASARESS